MMTYPMLSPALSIFPLTIPSMYNTLVHTLTASVAASVTVLASARRAAASVATNAVERAVDRVTNAAAALPPLSSIDWLSTVTWASTVATLLYVHWVLSKQRQQRQHSARTERTECTEIAKERELLAVNDKLPESLSEMSGEPLTKKQRKRSARGASESSVGFEASTPASPPPGEDSKASLRAEMKRLLAEARDVSMRTRTVVDTLTSEDRDQELSQFAQRVLAVPTVVKSKTLKRKTVE